MPEGTDHERCRKTEESKSLPWPGPQVFFGLLGATGKAKQSLSGPWG